MKPIHVLAIPGSLRAQSYNKMLLQEAVKIAQQYGAEVKVADLIDIPLYNADVEVQGFPESVKQIREQAEWADMFLICSPEYNHSIPGVLKNALDWISRQGNPMTGKTGAIFGASDGMFGTVRMQQHLRQVMASFNVLLLPQPQLMVRFAPKIFDTSGNLTDEKAKEKLTELVEKTIDLTKILKENHR